jgi:hypothetical protein
MCQNGWRIAVIRLAFDETIGECSIAHNRSEQIANIAVDIGAFRRNASIVIGRLSQRLCHLHIFK